MKLYIEKISRKQYTSKRTGKPYSKIWIRSRGEWYSAFAGKWNEDWAEGMSIEAAEIEESRGDDGKIWRQIKSPSPTQVNLTLNARLDDLEARIIELEAQIDRRNVPRETGTIEDDAPNYTDSDIPPEFK